jgi:hypothetical protein
MTALFAIICDVESLLLTWQGAVTSSVSQSVGRSAGKPARRFVFQSVSRWRTWVVHSGNAGVGLQSLGQLQGAAVGPLHPQVQSLQATVDQESGMGVDGATQHVVHQPHLEPRHHQDTMRQCTPLGCMNRLLGKSLGCIKQSICYCKGCRIEEATRVLPSLKSIHWSSSMGHLQ